MRVMQRQPAPVAVSDVAVSGRSAGQPGCHPGPGWVRYVRWMVRLALPPLLVLLAGTTAMAADPPPLRLGIMPFNSALALIKTHQPLRQYLQQSLGRPVEIFTAPDYAAFQRDSLAGGFDLLITGPHFGVMCLDKGYEPLFHYKASLKPIFVVRPDSGIRGWEQLRGRRIGLSSRLSVSSIVGLKWLDDKGLELGRDFQVEEKVSHGAAIAAVAVGELDAALTTFTPLRQVPADVQARVTHFATDAAVPHLMTLAHGRLGGPELARLRAALLAFPSSPEGVAFFRDTGYQGYEPISAADIKALKPYTPIVQRLMAP